MATQYLRDFNAICIFQFIGQAKTSVKAIALTLFNINNQSLAKCHLLVG